MNAKTGPSVWRLIAARWDEAMTKFPPNTLSYLTYGARTFINDAAFADEVEAFYYSHRLTGERKTVLQNIERMRVGLTFAAAMREQLRDEMTVGAFLGIFALMFVLELPDKTFLATVIMSTRARPAMVVIGGSVAMTMQMGIAVGAGR